MYERKTPASYHCGLNVTMKAIGGKWKACIVDALRHGPSRPSTLHRAIEGSVPRVLNMQLRELEECGIITKTVHVGLPLRVEYALTSLGESLLPLIDALERWGTDNKTAVVGILEASLAHCNTGAATRLVGS